MAAISPKADFMQMQPDAAKEARSQLPLPWFRMATQAALAHFALTGPTTEEMAGARKFLGLLVDIGEPFVEPQRLPVKTLSES